jgi:hypothetical protein
MSFVFQPVQPVNAELLSRILALENSLESTGDRLDALDHDVLNNNNRLGTQQGLINTSKANIVSLQNADTAQLGRLDTIDDQLDTVDNEFITVSNQIAQVNLNLASKTTSINYLDTARIAYESLVDGLVSSTGNAEARIGSLESWRILIGDSIGEGDEGDLAAGSLAAVWESIGSLTASVNTHDTTILTNLNNIAAIDIWKGGVDTWKSEIVSWKGGIDTWKSEYDTWKWGIDTWKSETISWKSQQVILVNDLIYWKDQHGHPWKSAYDSWTGGIDAWQATIDNWKLGLVQAGINSSWKIDIEAWRGTVNDWKINIEAWRGTINDWKLSVEQVGLDSSWKIDIEAWRESISALVTVLWANEEQNPDFGAQGSVSGSGDAAMLARIVALEDTDAEYLTMLNAHSNTTIQGIMRDIAFGSRLDALEAHHP